MSIPSSFTKEKHKMKKLILIIIMLLSTLVCASRVDSYTLPKKSGKYHAYVNDLKYSDGTDIKVGNSFWYAAWEDYTWYKSHYIRCEITDIDSINDSFHVLRLDCTVQEFPQFYNDNYTASITYTDLKGHRSDGTLKWSRDSIGSTDIYCYDRNGMSIIKHVNNPYRCK